MRNLGIFCGIGGGPSDLWSKIEQTFEFSQKFNSTFNEKFSCKKYGSSLEFISFGTTYISANSGRKEEIMFNLDYKEFIYSIVLTEKQIIESSINELIEIVISSIEMGIRYMKSLDVGGYDVTSMELDIKQVLNQMGYKYVPIDSNNELTKKAKFVIERNIDELDIFEQSNFYLKLFKNVRGKLRFWETWETELETAIIHSGTVGEKGHLQQIKTTDNLDYKSIVNKEIDKRIKEGYYLIDEDKFSSIRIDFTNIIEADKEKRKLELEKIVNEKLGWTGLGYVENTGLEINKVVIHCKVVNTEITNKVMAKAFKNNVKDYSIIEK